MKLEYTPSAINNLAILMLRAGKNADHLLWDIRKKIDSIVSLTSATRFSFTCGAKLGVFGLMTIESIGAPRDWRFRVTEIHIPLSSAQNWFAIRMSKLEKAAVETNALKTGVGLFSPGVEFVSMAHGLLLKSFASCVASPIVVGRSFDQLEMGLKSVISGTVLPETAAGKAVLRIDRLQRWVAKAQRA